MKLKTWLLVGGGLAVIVVGVGVALLLSSLDRIVKDAIETYGSQVTGTPVRVSSVHIDLAKGEGSLLGLRVGNPSGYSRDDVISFGEITLRLDLDSLTEQKPLVVSVVRVGAPTVNLIVDETGRSNLQALQENISRNTTGSSSGSSAGSAEDGGSPTRVSIRSFTFEDGRVTADLTAVGGEKVETKLPSLRMSNVGGRSGAEASEIGAILAREFVAQTLTSVGRSQAQKELDKLLDKHVGGAAGDAAKKLMNNLFNR